MVPLSYSIWLHNFRPKTIFRCIKGRLLMDWDGQSEVLALFTPSSFSIFDKNLMKEHKDEAWTWNDDWQTFSLGDYYRASTESVK